MGALITRGLQEGAWSRPLRDVLRLCCDCAATVRLCDCAAVHVNRYLRGCCVEMGPPYAITVMSFLLAGLWLVITLAQSSLALSITLNAVAFGCCTALYAHACATIADKLDDPRYAVVFSCNAMLSLVVASIAVAVGSSMVRGNGNGACVRACVRACMCKCVCACASVHAWW